MSQIIQFPTPKASAITPPAHVSAPPSYTALPAWLVGNATLNRACTDLQLQGWGVSATPDGVISCWHKEVNACQRITLAEAMNYQRSRAGWHSGRPDGVTAAARGADGGDGAGRAWGR